MGRTITIEGASRTNKYVLDLWGNDDLWITEEISETESSTVKIWEPNVVPILDALDELDLRCEGREIQHLRAKVELLDQVAENAKDLAVKALSQYGIKKPCYSDEYTFCVLDNIVNKLEQK